jgi:SAM-dependent methyltransferase
MTTDAANDIDFYYFDPVILAIEEGNQDVIRSFGHHNHWGYWRRPGNCTGTVEDFARAAEDLTRLLCDVAGIGASQRVLDVGCGFGGTIASIDARFDGMQLCGLNIDPRQLARAEALVKPRACNHVTWLRGDACEMPFEDRSFDAIMAIECIFHFSSRPRFFAEAARILEPGGALVLSDLVPWRPAANLLPQYVRRFHPAIARVWGAKMNLSCSRAGYRRLAATSGFEAPRFQDITRHILPTYDFCIHHIPEWHGTQVAATALPAFRALYRLNRLRLLRYEAISMRKVTP